MVWSGLTKYIHSMVHNSCKAVEIPGLGIVGPLVQDWQTYRDPLDKGTVTKSTFNFKDASLPKNVVITLNDNFVKEAELTLERRGERAVTAYS